MRNVAQCKSEIIVMIFSIVLFHLTLSQE